MTLYRTSRHVSVLPRDGGTTRLALGLLGRSVTVPSIVARALPTAEDVLDATASGAAFPAPVLCDLVSSEVLVRADTDETAALRDTLAAQVHEARLTTIRRG